MILGRSFQKYISFKNDFIGSVKFETRFFYYSHHKYRFSLLASLLESASEQIHVFGVSSTNNLTGLQVHLITHTYSEKKPFIINVFAIDNTSVC